LADGGNITSSGSVLVGELGPELLSLPTGAKVTPLDKQGNNISVNISGNNIYTDEDHVRSLVQQIERSLKASIRGGLL
jgi:hypothetical protein